MFLALLFTLLLWVILFLLWKWKKSYLLLFIYFMFHIQVGTYIIDQKREKEYEHAMKHDQNAHACGMYTGTSEIERGSQNNKYMIKLYHFEKADGQQLTFAHTDAMRSRVSNIDLLQEKPLPICFKYAPHFRDSYHFPMLIELEPS